MKFNKLCEYVITTMDIMSKGKEDKLYFSQWKANSPYQEWHTAKTDIIADDNEFIYLLVRGEEKMALKGKEGEYKDYTDTFLKDIKSNQGMEQMGTDLLRDLN